MSDLISRQAAIDATTETVFVEYEEDADKEESIIMQTKGAIRDRIKALPTVQPKRGKWIERNPLNSDKCRLIECDQCGNSYIVGFNVPYEHWIDNRNYCGKCGADMRGEADGQN